jgi:carboxymethylenebutenolidase
MTGGIGREKLTAFYRDHFIFKWAVPQRNQSQMLMLLRNPRDAALELVSRTVGSDRIVDEFIFHLTHDTAVDWLLPGMAPTGKKLAIPMVAVVHIRGDRLAHGPCAAASFRTPG